MSDLTEVLEAVVERKLPPALDFRSLRTTQPQPLDFVLPGFVAGTVGGLVSPGGTGKSTLALQLAVDVATGANTTGLGIQAEGRVCILAAEDPANVIHMRVRDLTAGLTDEQANKADERIRIIPCLGFDLDLAKFADAVLVMSEAIGTRLMIIDTLTRVHSLDENTATDAKCIMAVMEGIAATTMCAVLFAHHVNKAAALGGMAELQQAARGSSVWVDNARWLSFVATMSPEEAEAYGLDDVTRRGYLRFNVSKQNYGAPLPDRWLRRQGTVLYPVTMGPVVAAKKKKWK